MHIFKLLFILFITALTAANADVVLINDKQLNQNRLYRYEVQSIFMLRTTYWANGMPIVPIFLEFDDITHMKFVSSILRISPNNFDIIVQDKIQRGEVNHILMAHDVNDAIHKVQLIPGSVTYIPSVTLIPDTAGIQVIMVVD